MRLGYEGKEADSVVGDTDFNFRKYRPDLGIFTQPDSAIQNVYDPQQLDRYAFERNNPYTYVDDDGHFNVRLFGLGMAGFAGGSAILLRTGPLGFAAVHLDMAFGLVIMGVAAASPNTDDVADKYAHSLAWSPIISSVVAAKDLADGKPPTTIPFFGPVESVWLNYVVHKHQQEEVDQQTLAKRLQEPTYAQMLDAYYRSRLSYYQHTALDSTAVTATTETAANTGGQTPLYTVYDSSGAAYPTSNPNWTPREPGTPGGRGGGSSFDGKGGTSGYEPG